MIIKDLIKKYTEKGNGFRNALNLAAEEVLLTKISSSPLRENITLKGGIVMYNLSKSDRRVTQDIDFDFIRYSISEESIYRFIDMLNKIDDGIKVNIDGKFEQLQHPDYQGVRVKMLFSDESGDTLKIKLDIGVHTNIGIEQEKIIFSFNDNIDGIEMQVNPCEQIFVEKLLSLAKFGAFSTRYKDIYDMYYFIKQNLLEMNKVEHVLESFYKTRKDLSMKIDEIIDSLTDTFNNKEFAKEASKPSVKWLDVDFNHIKDTIITYLNNVYYDESIYEGMMEKHGDI